MFCNIDKASKTDQMAIEPEVILQHATIAGASNNQEFELTPPGEAVVMPEEPEKKRSNIRLIAIVVALNVS